MTKKRFIIQLIITLIIVSWGIVFGGNTFLLYLDLPTLIFVPILPFIIATFIYPLGEQKEFNREIFKEAGAGDKKKLEQAINFYKMLKKLTIVAIIVATFIGAIGILGFLSDIDSLAKNLGVLSISIFYGVIFILTVVEPLKGAAKKNLIG